MTSVMVSLMHISSCSGSVTEVSSNEPMMLTNEQIFHTFAEDCITNLLSLIDGLEMDGDITKEQAQHLRNTRIAFTEPTS